MFIYNVIYLFTYAFSGFVVVIRAVRIICVETIMIDDAVCYFFGKLLSALDLILYYEFIKNFYFFLCCKIPFSIISNNVTVIGFICYDI